MTTNEQKIKKSNKGFDIFSRIVTALVAAATYPVVIFTSLFYLAYTIPIWPILSQDSTDTGATYFKASIYELMTTYAGGKGFFKLDSSLLSGDLAVLKRPLIVVLGLYGAICILALIIIVFAAFTRKKLPIIVSSVLGICALIGIPFAFNALEAPFADGTINLDTFLHTGLEGIMSLVVTFDFLKEGEAYTLLWVIFVALLAWTGAVMIVNIGDEPKKVKEPKVKKVKKEKAAEEK